MDLAAVIEIVKTLGISGVFLAGLVYVYRTQEAKDKRTATESREREQRLGKRLDATEEYIRTTLAGALDRNTAAHHEVSEACRDLQRAVMNAQYVQDKRP